jgi:hypothetical protein
MHTFLKILTVSFLMLEAAGCGCTDLGCLTLFEVAFNKTSTDWEPGKYVVEVEADGVKNSCTVEMPIVAAPFCTDSRQLQLDLLPLSGAAQESKGLRSAMVFGAPTLVKITVARDGVALETNTLMPKYTEVSPNGEMCGPTCQVAAGELTIP